MDKVDQLKFDRSRNWPRFLRQQFKIWHLLILTAIVATVCCWVFPSETFSIDDSEEAAEYVAKYSRIFDLELRETLGESEGPFRLPAVIHVNRGQAPNRKIRYSSDGSMKTFVIPKSLDDVRLIALFFRSPKHDSLVFLCEERTDYVDGVVGIGD